MVDLYLLSCHRNPSPRFPCIYHNVDSMVLFPLYYCRLRYILYVYDVAQETAANYVTLKIIILTSSIKVDRVSPDIVYFLFIYLFIYLFIRLIFCE